MLLWLIPDLKQETLVTNDHPKYNSCGGWISNSNNIIRGGISSSSE